MLTENISNDSNGFLHELVRRQVRSVLSLDCVVPLDLGFKLVNHLLLAFHEFDHFFLRRGESALGLDDSAHQGHLLLSFIVRFLLQLEQETTRGRVKNIYSVKFASICINHFIKDNVLDDFIINEGFNKLLAKFSAVPEVPCLFE